MLQDRTEQTEAPEKFPPADVAPRFPIIGVGASAGGLEALKELLRGMPPSSGLALAVVQHLDPTHESQMASLLAGYTTWRVRQVEEGLAPEPDTVYTLAPGRYLTLRGGVFHLEPPPGDGSVRMPIDRFFRSLAEDRQEQAVCVVLSGSGTDGTLGVRAVRGAGGVAIAQDPDTAEYDSMPRNAIATGLVDLVLPPREIGPALVRSLRTPSAGALAWAEPAEPSPSSLEEVLNLLLRAGTDFRGYKRGTLSRRIERRMGLNQITTLSSYAQLLRERPEEATRLAKDLLIGVTGFFRDPEAYEELRRLVVAPLVRAATEDRPLRVWVVGCSTGEEAYSLAILFLEELQAAGRPAPVQVFASDLDEEALGTARAGVYPETIAADVSAERLPRFFVSSDHNYRVSRELRDAVVFTAHNVVADPPFSRMDLVSCRNVLIYLGPDLQQRLVSLLGFALNPGGYLFLGRSDSLPGGNTLFSPVSPRQRIYQRTAVTRHDVTDFPRVGPRGAPPLAPRGGPPPPLHLAAAAQRLLLEQYAAGLVLIDAKGEILYFCGETDSYLRRPTGAPDLNLFSTAREKLPRRLRAAVRQALERNEPVRMEHVTVEGGDGPFYVNVTVRPGAESPPGQPLVAVIFEEVEGAAPAPADLPAVTDVEGSASLALQLEGELKTTREELRVTAAEHSAAMEELRAAHEEAVSMNEELRSTNEELEASKEELQSINEELNTLNAELREKINELNATNSDLANLLSATEIATVFLDRELRIRRFTPSATALLNLLPVDVGRPVSDISPRFRGNDLALKAEQVLRDLAIVEEEVRTREGRWYLMRLLPYRSLQDRIEGVVATFTDVTGLKQAEQESDEARIYAESIVATVRQPLLVLDSDLRVVSANPAFYQNFGASPGETLERPLPELGNRQWAIPNLIRLLAEIIPEQAQVQDYEVEHEFLGLGRRTMLLNARRIDRAGDRPPLVLLVIEDVSERKRAQQLAEAMVAEISHRTKNNLAIVASLLQLQADRKDADGLSTGLIQDAITRIRAFAALHEQVQAGEPEQIEVLEAVRRVAEIARTTLSVGGVEVKVEGEPVAFPFQDSTNLAVVAGELITNALKYGAPDPTGVLRLNVEVHAPEGRLTLSVWNSGNPVPEDLDLSGTKATGLFLVQNIVVDHYGGEFRLEPYQGGTRAEIVLPQGRLRQGA